MTREIPTFFKAKELTDAALAQLHEKPASHWIEEGEKNAVELFRFSAESVPAYQKFLKNAKVEASEIKTVRDFKKLPVTSKKGYVLKNDFADLFPYGDISRLTTFSATSGSTGEPAYFPRTLEQDAQYEYIAELFLRNQFEIDKKKTLVIVGFGLGIWIGGIFTYSVLRDIARKGYPISIAPIGTHKDLFLRTVKKFGERYDQVILMGYPPFIKDIIDEALEHDIKWQDYRVRILTATEPFTEGFRDYLVEKAGIQNTLTDIINIYGTVELGTMAHETALTTLIRKKAVEDGRVFKAIFGDAGRLPTLAQYHPYLTYLEEENGQLLGTGYGSAMPLIRYSFPDRGGVISFEEMKRRFAKLGILLDELAREVGISETVFRLPFVFVYERADLSTNLVGIAIYPEYIRAALEHPDVAPRVTGKFTAETKTDERHNQYLEVNVELQKNIEANDSLAEKTADAIVTSLVNTSTEYNHLYSTGSEKYRAQLTPRVVFWPYGDTTYFAGTGKQKWIKIKQ